MSAWLEWSWAPEVDSRIPHVPDLTYATAAPSCDAEHPSDWICTRRLGHTGRHAAGDGWRICAVWGDR